MEIVIFIKELLLIQGTLAGLFVIIRKEIRDSRAERTKRRRP